MLVSGVFSWTKGNLVLSVFLGIFASFITIQMFL
jgi:hypothetical protein